MFLDVGNQKTIRSRDVVGIFDTDNTTVSTVTRKYLTAKEREGLLESAGEDIPKSFVLYRDGKRCRICFSRLSSTVLIGRMNGISE